MSWNKVYQRTNKLVTKWKIEKDYLTLINASQRFPMAHDDRIRTFRFLSRSPFVSANATSETNSASCREIHITTNNNISSFKWTTFCSFYFFMDLSYLFQRRKWNKTAQGFCCCCTYNRYFISCQCQHPCFNHYPFIALNGTKYKIQRSLYLHVQETDISNFSLLPRISLTYFERLKNAHGNIWEAATSARSHSITWIMK